MLCPFCGSGQGRWSEEQKWSNYNLVTICLCKHFLFRTRKCPWYQNLPQNSYFNASCLAVWGSASDLSSVEVESALYHSTHLTPRPGPTNLAFHPDSSLPTQRIQIIVGISWATFTQFRPVLASLHLLWRRKKNQTFPFASYHLFSSLHKNRIWDKQHRVNDSREHESSNVEPGNTNTVVARVWNVSIFHRNYTVIFV